MPCNIFTNSKDQGVGIFSGLLFCLPSPQHFLGNRRQLCTIASSVRHADPCSGSADTAYRISSTLSCYCHGNTGKAGKVQSMKDFVRLRIPDFYYGKNVDPRRVSVVPAKTEWDCRETSGNTRAFLLLSLSPLHFHHGEQLWFQCLLMENNSENYLYLIFITTLK